MRFIKEEAEAREKSFHLSRHAKVNTGVTSVNCVLLRTNYRLEIIALSPNYYVISEVNSVLLRKRLRIEKSAPMWSSTLYPSFRGFFRAQKALAVSTFRAFFKKIPSMFFKFCDFGASSLALT